MGLFTKTKQILCPYCERHVDTKIIKHWKKRVTFEDPCDGQLLGCGHLEGKYQVQYQKLLVLHHNRGIILNRHRCQGSGRKKTIKWVMDKK
mgnify:FL=1|jgi:hypothetical protein